MSHITATVVLLLNRTATFPPNCRSRFYYFLVGKLKTLMSSWKNDDIKIGHERSASHRLLYPASKQPLYGSLLRDQEKQYILIKLAFPQRLLLLLLLQRCIWANTGSGVKNSRRILLRKASNESNLSNFLNIWEFTQILYIFQW